VHDHRTLFPIPLAEAGLFDPETWGLTAREAAKEAAAGGVAMTFAPGGTQLMPLGHASSEQRVTGG